MFPSPKSLFSQASSKSTKPKYPVEDKKETDYDFDEVGRMSPCYLDSEPSRKEGEIGIINETGYWCFYITNIQALHKTKALSRLL